MPYRTVAQAAPVRWRDANRRLAASSEGSPDWQQASIDEELARRDYQDAIDEARKAHLPEPPPFHEASRETTTDVPKTDMNAEGDDGQVYGG